MRRLAIMAAGLSAAALVLSAGCSSAVTGAAQLSPASGSATITTNTAAPADPDALLTEAPGESATIDTTGADPTSGSSVNPLDGSTELYFAAFCISADTLTQKLNELAVDEAQYAADELAGGYVTTLAEAAEIAGNAVGVLEKAPTPQFPDSTQLTAAAIERYTALEQVLTGGAAKIDLMLAPSKAELRDAIDQVKQEVQQAVADTAVDIDDDVLAAARQIPECVGVGL
ncbi:MAG: hypothetical protein ABWZ98_14045 [Nakamurella sp.]